MNFDFSVPITWGDIISTLSVVIAIVAACVAIKGNRQSQKQFSANMKKQEQALNLSLFDKRIEILELVSNNDFSFNRNRIPFLFSEEITVLISQYDRALQEKERFESFRSIYLNKIHEKAENDNDDEAQDFLPFFGKYCGMQPGKNCSQIEYERYTEIVNNYRIQIGDEALGIECKPYSIIEIDSQIDKLKCEAEQSKILLVGSIKTFIKDSISGAPL